MSVPTAMELRKHLGARGSNARCPVAGHEDKHGSLSISDGPDGKALFKCHAGCSQADIIEAMQAKGIWPKPSTGLTLEELATAKSLPQALLRESGFSDDTWKGRDCVRMEYRDRAGSVSCVRYRGALTANGSDMRFWFRRGDKQQLFGLWRLKAEPVIIVEGETDSIALWDAGFNAIGVPGADAWKDQRFAEHLKDCPGILVHLEPDGGGEKFRAAFEKSMLKDRVRFFTVAPTAKDPCELRARDPQGFKATIEAAIETAKSEQAAEIEVESDVAVDQHDTAAPDLLPLAPVSTWVSRPAPAPRDWVVAGIIPGGRVTSFLANGGDGKTTISVQFAVHAAISRSIYGIPVSGGPVLGIWCEDEQEEIERKVRAACAAEQIELEQLDQLVMISRDGMENLLCTFDRDQIVFTPFYRQLDATIATFKPRLVILDTLADLFGGDFMSTPHVRQFIKTALGGLCVRHGCAILLVAHPSASGISSGDGAGFSTAWNNSVRSRLYLRRPQSDDKDAIADRRILEVRKSNYAATGLSIPLVYDRGVFIPDPEPVNDSPSRRAPKIDTPLATAALEYMTANGAGGVVVSFTPMFEALQAAGDLPKGSYESVRKSLQRTLGELQKACLIVTSKVPRGYRLSPFIRGTRDISGDTAGDKLGT